MAWIVFADSHERTAYMAALDRYCGYPNDEAVTATFSYDHVSGDGRTAVAVFSQQDKDFAEMQGKTVIIDLTADWCDQSETEL